MWKNADRHIGPDFDTKLRSNGAADIGDCMLYICGFR
jgi:hypothetical protein